VVDEETLEQVLSGFLRIFPANHYSSTARYPSITTTESTDHATNFASLSGGLICDPALGWLQHKEISFTSVLSKSIKRFRRYTVVKAQLSPKVIQT
jgi:hypothetical protein